MSPYQLPIVYSCSGCSSAAQMANYLALKLDRAQLAEMSCIAGLGGDVKKMVHTAKKASEIIAIDGCALSCTKATLKRHGLYPSTYYQLADMGVQKQHRTDFDINQANELLELITKQLNNTKIKV